MMDAPHFADFLVASDLDPQSGRLFNESIQQYAPTRSLRVLSAPSLDRPLVTVDDRLSELAQMRRSQRECADGSLTAKQLGALLSVFAQHEGTRTFPSAGGLYPLEIVCATAHIEEFERALWVYNADNHSLGKICALPNWAGWQSVLSSGVETEPALSVFFCLALEDILAKYGERGGRFALLEAGHAGQMFALRAAQDSISTYAIGGVLDQEFSRLCGFDHLPAQIALAMTYVCGPQATTTDRLAKRRLPRWRLRGRKGVRSSSAAAE
jgi:SagB-type dehydrogenase family enzyme